MRMSTIPAQHHGVFRTYLVQHSPVGRFIPNGVVIAPGNDPLSFLCLLHGFFQPGSKLIQWQPVDIQWGQQHISAQAFKMHVAFRESWYDGLSLKINDVCATSRHFHGACFVAGINDPITPDHHAFCYGVFLVKRVDPGIGKYGIGSLPLARQEYGCEQDKRRNGSDFAVWHHKFL